MLVFETGMRTISGNFHGGCEHQTHEEQSCDDEDSAEGTGEYGFIVVIDVYSDVGNIVPFITAVDTESGVANRRRMQSLRNDIVEAFDCYGLRHIPIGWGKDQ